MTAQRLSIAVARDAGFIGGQAVNLGIDRGFRENGMPPIVADVEYWRDPPLWDPDSTAKTAAGWFKALAPEVQ